MFGSWLTFANRWAILGYESQQVMALRLMRFALGTTGNQAEAKRMITEKVAAFGEAQVAAAGALAKGGTPRTAAKNAMGVYRKRVRANKRRLTR